jgi:hypothetical protein
MDEGRKRVLLIAASILAARKLAQYDSGARVPATVAAIADGVRGAERIMEEIDRRHPSKPAPGGEYVSEGCQAISGGRSSPMRSIGCIPHDDSP